MKIATRTLAIAIVVALFATSSVARADERGYYGVVESANGADVVIRTDNSVGHWKLAPELEKARRFRLNDWVEVNVETSGVIVKITIWDHATAHSGVVKKVNGGALTVRSGNSTETWTVVPTTALHGVERGQIQEGDEISTQQYKDHKIADLTLIQRGVK